jgi:ABC-type sulfate transport system permease subunit
MSDKAWGRIQAIVIAFIIIFGLSFTWFMENHEEKGAAILLNNTWLVFPIVGLIIIMAFLIIFAGVRRQMGEVNRKTFLVSFFILLGVSFFFSITRL